MTRGKLVERMKGEQGGSKGREEVEEEEVQKG